MTADVDALELAARLFGSIDAGDLRTVDECLHPELEVWTNFDDRTVDKERALRTIGWLVGAVADLSYDIVRRVVVDDGFVQQHVLCGTAPSGAAIAMPACIVARVRDGRVVRMDEYADPSGLIAAMSA